MKKRFTDKQIISILREAEAGVSVQELFRRHAVSDAAFHNWRRKSDGMKDRKCSGSGNLKRRMHTSGICLLKPCRIKRRYRWLRAESSDDRPEMGGRVSHVRDYGSVVTLCIEAGRPVPVDLPL